MSRVRTSPIAFAVATLGLLVCAALAVAASRAVTLTKVSSDPYRNIASYHATEVEPDTFAHGKTIVAAFQVGRFPDGAADNIGWARFSVGGHWTHGLLPGTTAFSTPKGPYARESDPSVAYDAAHATWLIAGLSLSNSLVGKAVIVNRSTAGARKWHRAVTIAAASGNQSFDKDWIVCDDTVASPHYGSCYAEWDDNGNGNQLHMAYSRDGGKTWTQSNVPTTGVVGGQPVVQPDGDVVMPIDDTFSSNVESFLSTDGGLNYTGPTTVATVKSHLESAQLRSGPLPTAAVASDGRVYVGWADCRFRTNCEANDIVYSSSTDGTHWSDVQRVPIDAVSSSVDHFLPGLDAGPSGKLALVFYYYPQTACTLASCQLDVGFVSSSDGGSSWTSPTQLAGPTKMKELPYTTQGYMVGDYSSVSLLTTISGDPAMSVFAVGLPVKHESCTIEHPTTCDVPMEAPASPLPTTGAAPFKTIANPVLSTRSDHSARTRVTAR